ncbi:uncharacterized protein LOC123428182 isoform X1 [Hordeum vulgare subsp. vulgare]|uniref:uncharacterized protein LOC123428182 isoform X1 n=1 Tax=Hordeum vulgare subsp. vulgare TaxID=112509 RepID=UPI000B4668AB|nr:uncharacterized protein LOC123428182 isoform X1 [Hordeum vulgare subsp. vulgare]XP_044968301.1 uncharacterized protein LOC123428182 isoform X1 [Hordeum vulgare subsp. vulgare]
MLEAWRMRRLMERELDRRSNDWSARLARFQAEEQRLRDRVMELAEQNVSFQREVTLFESKQVEASNKIRSLELQNKQLNDEMEKVKGKVGVPKQLFVNTDPLSIPAAVMRAGLSLPLGRHEFNGENFYHDGVPLGGKAWTQQQGHRL